MEADRAPDGAILAGIEVLVVEDEYHLAFELKALVEGAGGRVAGPFADAAGAIAQLDRHRPDCGVVDVNLGSGISFAAADALVDRAIPFLFLTGYDAAALPDRFTGVDRIEKPADLARVLRKLAVLAGPRPG
jgi:two-component SAPR family response regulator